MNNFVKFWSAWLRSPAGVGAIVPSSTALARAMADSVDPNNRQLVVELGAGTGAITQVLTQRLLPEQLIIVERDAQLAGLLQRRFPTYHITTSDARHLPATLNELGHPGATAVISGLPLLSLPADLRSAIIRAVANALNDNGQLVQFTYGPAAPLSTEESNQYQLYGRRARYVLWNLPPASVWNYSKSAAGRTEPG